MTPPHECRLCYETIPPGEMVYGPLFVGGTKGEDKRAWARAFETKHPSDIVLCGACRIRYGKDAEPMDWLPAMKAEEGHVLSREDCLRLLGD
jgi:hypothetical protein